MVKVILDQYFKLTEGVKKDELERAKTQLKSQLMMNLEIRPVMFEDLARQVLINGHRKKPQEYLEKIDKVKNEDIVRIAEKMLVTKPAVVGYGDLRKLPRYEAIDQAVANRSYSKL
ncbi:peptidase M16 inactive domain-containing protein [Aphelenchoides avenae]|nr:peptidase M16 inactive domain-containing protein [Aphelenchus avenae]